MAVELTKRLFSVHEYHRMGEAGILSEEDRIELIEGEIVQMSPIGSRHQACVDRLDRIFQQRVGHEAIVRVQGPIRLSDYSEPQPDITLLRPRGDFYASAHPGSADVLLVVEVAETSVEIDRKTKAVLYARAGIPELWVADLTDEGVEAHRDPSGDGYRTVQKFRRAQRLSPQVFPGQEFSVDEILG